MTHMISDALFHLDQTDMILALDDFAKAAAELLMELRIYVALQEHGGQIGHDKDAEDHQLCRLLDTADALGALIVRDDDDV